MKSSMKFQAMRLVSKLAQKEAIKSANSSCMCFAFQPKLPEAVKKLRKF